MSRETETLFVLVDSMNDTENTLREFGVVRAIKLFVEVAIDIEGIRVDFEIPFKLVGLE